MADFEAALVAAVASAIGQHMTLRESPEQIARAALTAAEEWQRAFPSGDELRALYGKPERADAATVVLDLLGRQDIPLDWAFAWRYPSVEAFEAFARSNRVRNGLEVHGPAVTDDGVFGVTVIPVIVRPEMGRRD